MEQKITKKEQQVLDYLMVVYNNGELLADITYHCREARLDFAHNAILTGEGMMEKRMTGGRPLYKWMTIRPNIHMARTLMEKVKAYKTESLRKAKAKKTGKNFLAQSENAAKMANGVIPLPDDATDEERRIWKARNFGKNYGMSEEKLADYVENMGKENQGMNPSVVQAKETIHREGAFPLPEREKVGGHDESYGVTKDLAKKVGKEDPLPVETKKKPWWKRLFN
jgi:hypothetical protein